MNTGPQSVVNGIEFPAALSNNTTYTIQAGLKGFALWRFRFRVYSANIKARQELKRTIRIGKCYYGPFKGEFGHFLAHTLPFLMYLHKNRVKIVYCGMNLHRPFMVDENGNSIIAEFRELRDFFKEVSPRTNSTVPPADVQKKIEEFEAEASSSGIPFWNIGDDFYYWFIHRNWLSKSNTHYYKLDAAYRTKKENSCVILPRSKGALVTKNNGEPWNYEEVISILIPHFDKVYVCGHPSQVQELKINDSKVEIAVTTENSVLLQKMSNSRLIVTQHSGIVYAGEYTGTDILLIYKGGNKIQDIGSFNNTLHFKQQFPGRSHIYFAFNEDEIQQQLNKLTSLKKNELN